MFRNSLPRFEILTDDALATVEHGWRRLASEIGVQFDHPRALELFREAGMTVEDDGRVRFDPDFLLEQAALAPREFDMRARNPANDLHIGGDTMIFAPTQGPPFVRIGDERREGTLADFEQLARLSQVFDELDTPGGLCCEPNDRPLDSRHLDMLFAVQTLTDKPYLGAVISEEAARDSIAMTDLLFGGRPWVRGLVSRRAGLTG